MRYIDGSTDERPQKKAAPARKKKQHGKSWRFWHGFFTVILVLLLIGIVSFTAIAGYFVHDIKQYANSSGHFDLSDYTANQDRTTIIYAYDSEGATTELTRLHGSQNRIWVSLSDIPVNLQNAYIALEDKRFRTHHGVDWVSTISVSIHGFKRGGSTITQQLIKNLTNESGRTFSRKYNEIKNALYLEKHYSKDTILESYLNTLYLDAGCYGVQTAAEYYFGKDVSDLTLAECATIAAITKAPRTYDPILNYDNNRQRMELCLSDMLEQGLISSSDYDAAMAEKITFTGIQQITQSSSNDDNSDESYQSYYVDYVVDTVISDLQTKYDLTYGEATRKLYYGGLKIYTAVDMDVQADMENIYYNRTGIKSEKGTSIQSAMTVMNYEGRLCGIIGRLGAKSGNRVLNIASDSPRQPGSSIKPLSVYAPAIDTNTFYWSSYLLDYSPMTVDGSPWPKNYGGGTGSNDYVNLAEAIAPSLNTIPARIIQKLGKDVSFDYLTNKFHISTATDDDKNYAALAVGGMTKGVTTLEMAAAYATFGNGGKYYKPWCYYKVENSSGDTILQPDLSPEQVIEESSANVMNHLLQTVVTASDGTARSYKIGSFQMFAKTGTTSDNYDMWLIGGTPYYIAATWAGYEQNEEISKTFFGGSPAGILFQEVMTKIHSGLDSDKEFTDCDDCVQLKFCTSTGKRASSGCSTSTGWYKSDNIPSYCNGSGGHNSSATKAKETDDAGDGNDNNAVAAGDGGTTKATATTAAAATTKAAAAANN